MLDLQLLGNQIVPGYIRGMLQPALRLRLKLIIGTKIDGSAPLTTDPWDGLDRSPHALQRLVESRDSAGTPWLAQLAEGLMRIQITAGLSVLTPAILEGMHQTTQPSPTNQGTALKEVEALLLIPSVVPNALRGVVQGLMAHLAGQARARHEPVQVEALSLSALTDQLRSLVPSGTNQRHFLRFADDLGIPVIPLPGRVYQFGWGQRARLFNSSLTDGTSAIATAWAKDKRSTNILFRMAGLPVPAQVPVLSLEEAVAAAERIGFPVVLKPAALDQGRGVEADLRSVDELKAAYARSRQHAVELVLEKHVPGEDYRVYVVQGKVVGVAHRVPAGLWGDGRSTVADLLAAENAARQQTVGAASVYKPIEWDEEARELLQRHGLSIDSVPSAGQFIRLRRSANSSRGGSSVDVTSSMHPDNVALCVKAAALMRLDIAGLDLLIPDVSRSWREVGAAFCEVNAQPQMGGAHPWIFGSILKTFLKAAGRIPVVLVLGTLDEFQIPQAITRDMAETRPFIKMVSGDGPQVWEQGRAALMAPDTDALVLHTDGVGLAGCGLPVDRFDVLVLTRSVLKLKGCDALVRLVGPQIVAGVVIESEVLDHELGTQCQAALQRMLGVHRVSISSGADAVAASVFKLSRSW